MSKTNSATKDLEALSGWCRDTAQRCFNLHYKILGARYGKDRITLNDEERSIAANFGFAAEFLQRITRELSMLPKDGVVSLEAVKRAVEEGR